MSLGSMITQARKSAGLTIDDLSESTNIRTALLKEMESNSFANCGGETYARGHIRNIALKLGIDPQIFVSAFEEEHMQSDRSMRDLLIENSVMRVPQEIRKVSWKVLAAISVGSLLLVALGQIIISNSSSTDIPDPISTIAASQTPAPSTEPVPVAEATVSSGSGVELVIKATRAKSWLFVTDATGRALFSGQIAKGMAKTFTTDVSLNIKVGNAGGVDLVVNGRELDSIGADGEVVSVSYGVDS